MTLITVLNTFEEEEALRRLKKNARQMCSTEIQAFVDCSKTGLVSIAWNCRDANKTMNDCLSNYSSEDQLDGYREQVLKDKLVRLESANPSV